MVALNILIVTGAMIVVNIVFAYLGISIHDYPITFYLVFYSVIGFGGAFLSLQFSVYFAKKFHGVRLIDPASASSAERKLMNQIQILSRKAGLPKTPEIGVYESPEVNAFATGPSKKKSLVAFSTGLLNAMDEEEVEGVLAHEISHIANGDMVTMTLVMGLVNTMVLVLARICTMVVTSQMKRRSFFLEYMIFMAFQVVFNILGSVLIVNVFSKIREYKADKGGAKLAGKSKMIKALKKLQSIHTPLLKNQNANYNTLKISHPSRKEPSMLQYLFSTHPPLSSRIHRLERLSMIS